MPWVKVRCSLMKVRVGSDRGVELPRREQDLAVLPVDPVAVVVHRDEVVVGADLLQLAEGLQQRLAIPEPHVLDGRRVGPDVRQGEVGLAGELAGLDAVQSPGLPGRRDVVAEIGSLPGQLGGRHQKLLHEARNQTAPDDRRQPGSRRSPSSGIATQLSPCGADDDGCSGQNATRRRDPESRQRWRGGRCSWRLPAGRWWSRAGWGCPPARAGERSNRNTAASRAARCSAGRRLDPKTGRSSGRPGRSRCRPGGRRPDDQHQGDEREGRQEAEHGRERRAG